MKCRWSTDTKHTATETDGLLSLPLASNKIFQFYFILMESLVAKQQNFYLAPCFMFDFHVWVISFETIGNLHCSIIIIGEIQAYVHIV